MQAKRTNDLTVYDQDLELKDRLKEFRKSNKLSVEALAQRLGAKSYTLRRWEAGSSKPSRDAADALSAIGFGAIADSETNLSSRSRGGDWRARSIISEPTLIPVQGLESSSFPSWVANGPSDQEAFYNKLLELQVAGGVDPTRLSIVDEFRPGSKTRQSLLENPKRTATSWNSNYGSHGWHRYVGRFPPHVVRALLNHFGAGAGTVVCDPFSGSGTTAVECRLLGIPFIGIEIGALSHLMGEVKASFEADPAILISLAARYGEFFTARHNAFMQHSGPDFSVADVLARDGNPIPTFANVEKWFEPEAFLGTSLTVEFSHLLSGFEKKALLIALSAKMRSIGNVDVDVVRAEYRKKPRENVNVSGLVIRQLKKMAADISEMTKTHGQTIGEPSSIKLIEGSALSAKIRSASIDAIITSPPYGVEALSYLRTHLLSYRSLASELDHDPYDVRDQTIGSEYLEETILPKELEIEKVSPTFAKFFKNAQGADKKSKQRRAGMMKFFEDMHQIGRHMSDWLKDGGKVAWVIGNKRLGDDIIPTNKIIEESFAANNLHLYDSIKHKLKTNNSNSQVPWQERIIQEEETMLFVRRPRQ